MILWGEAPDGGGLVGAPIRRFGHWHWPHLSQLWYFSLTLLDLAWRCGGCTRGPRHWPRLDTQGQAVNTALQSVPHPRVRLAEERRGTLVERGTGQAEEEKGAPGSRGPSRAGKDSPPPSARDKGYSKLEDRHK